MTHAMTDITSAVTDAVARADAAGPVCCAAYQAARAAHGSDEQAHRAAVRAIAGRAVSADRLDRAVAAARREFDRWVVLSDRDRAAVLDTGATWEAFFWSCYAAEALRVLDADESVWQRTRRWLAGR